MLSVYEKNALIKIKTGGSFDEESFDDWESAPTKLGESVVTLEAYLHRGGSTLKTSSNSQRGVDEALDKYHGFIWPPAKLPANFGNRQHCEIEFTDGSERKGIAEVTRRPIASKRLLQRMNDDGDRIEVTFAAQLVGVA